MGITRTAYQRKLDRLHEAVDNGVVQGLVDSGWTILSIARKYEVSESKIRNLGVKHGGPIKFPKAKAGIKYDKQHLSDWTDAKKLALTGKW